MRIPDDAKKCVVFIGVKKVDSVVEEFDFVGTAFIVSVRSSKNQKWSFPHIVTAKHIAEGLKGTDIYIRFNKKDGSSAIFRVKANTIEWWFHQNDGDPNSCDVAVFPLIVPQEIHNTMDYTAIGLEMLLTDNMRVNADIGEGDEVYTVGLFYNHQGDTQNPPIVRMGNIAMIPDEPIVTKRGREEAYLIELRSLSGLSGSPVFVLKPDRGEITENGLYHVIFKTYLIGLISGHWEKKSDNMNIGIAYVSPAKKILEIINRPELAAHRAKHELDYLANNSTSHEAPRCS